MKTPQISLADIVKHDRATLDVHGQKTRKSVSMRPELYLRIKRASAKSQIPLARLVDKVLTSFLDANACPDVTRDEALVALKFALPKKKR